MSQPAATGLSEAEAAARLARFGPNRIERTRRRTALRILGDTARQPMVLLLAAAALLSLVFGDLAEGLFLAGGTGVSVLLSVAQQMRSERALDALRTLAAPRAEVMRAGIKRSIPQLAGRLHRRASSDMFAIVSAAGPDRPARGACGRSSSTSCRGTGSCAPSSAGA